MRVERGIAPVFSVIVPVYNAGKLLVPAVESVLGQTFGELELILIDDGSRDGCLEFVKGLQDSRIRVRTQANSGAPAAINTGLAEASGEWVALLDHDDTWRPRKLQAHLDAVIKHPGTDLSFDWSRWIDGEGNDLDLPSRAWQGTISFEQLLQDFVIGNSSAMVIRRAAIDKAGPMNPKLHRVYDLDLCLRIAALRPENVRAVPEYLTGYRRHEGQMSSDWRKMKSEWEHMLSLVPGYAPYPVDRYFPVANSNVRRYLSWVASESGEPGAAFRLALSAFQAAPLAASLDARNWLILAAAAGQLVLPGSVYRAAVGVGKRLFR